MINMRGKIIDGKLVIAGYKIQIKNGWITSPTIEQLIENGYKEVVYNEKPEYNIEEEKLVETYVETDVITVNYEKIALTDEEHNQVIQYKIIEEENKITQRRQREIDLKKEGALEFAETIENNIIALRKKFR